MRYILSVLVLLPTILFGQSNLSVNGNLVTAKGQEIPFANITINKQGSNVILQGAVSDEFGAFEFTHLEEGLYSIQAFFLGYEPFMLDSVWVQEVSNSLGSLMMRRKATELEEITVVSEKAAVENHPGMMVYNVEAGGNIGDNALDVFNNIPSLGLDMDDNVTLKGAKATILIDGVESDLADMLDQLPSDVISSIEVISNPSAKYDSKNGGGIINIKLKNDRLSGYNHKFSAGYGFPERYALTASTSVSSKKWSFGISTSFKEEPKEDNRITDRTILIEEGSKYLHQEQNNLRNQNTFFVRANTRYKFSKKSNISFQTLFQQKKAPLVSNYLSESLNNDSVLYNLSQNLREEENESGILEFTSHWRKTFNNSNKHKIMVQAKYSTSNPSLNYMRLTQALDVATYEPLTNFTKEIRTGDDVNRSGLVKVDYELPIHKRWKFELGAQLKLRHFEQDKISDKYSYKNAEELKSTRHNEVSFMFDEIKPSVYTVVNGTKGKYSFSAGLRFEGNYFDQYIHALDSTITISLTTFSPSVLIEKKVSDKYTWGVSYTRKDKVPSYRQLNPISLNFGGYFRNSGNPDLKSQQTQSLDFNHHLKLNKKTVSGSFFINHVENLIGTYYSFTEEEDKIITHSKVDNLGSMSNIGMEISSSLPWSKFVFRPSLTAYYKRLDGSKLSSSLDKENIYLMAKLSLNYNATKKFSVQMSANYNGTDISPQGKRYSYYMMNVSLKYKMLDKKGLLSLKMNDLLDSYDYKKFINQREDQINSQFFNPVTQYVYLVFSYKLSSLKKK